MTHTRRKFLTGLSLFTAAALYPFPLLAQTVAPDRYLIVGSNNSICAINLATRQVRSVPVGFSAHGFAQNPQHPERIWGIEKWGPAAAEVDFKTLQSTNRLSSPQTAGFFGHGFFDAKGETLYAVQTDLTTGLGHLIGYEAGKYVQVKDYQVTPGALHDCHLLPDNTFLVVSHGSTMMLTPDGKHNYKPMIENASLIRFDPQQNKQIDKKSIEDKDQILGHFAIAADGTIIALGIPRPDKDPSGSDNTPSTRGGAIYHGQLDKPGLRRIALPPEVENTLRGEVLSIALDEAAHIATVTNPESATLVFIDLANGTYLGRLKSAATGISYDAGLDRFICSDAKLSTIDSDRENLSPMPLKTIDGRNFTDPLSGAHSMIVRMTI